MIRLSPLRPNRAAALRLACLTGAGLIGGLFAGAGCTSFKTSTAANLAAEPPETQTFVGRNAPIRDFDQSVAYYQNGDTASGSTGMRWASRDITSIPSGGGSASGGSGSGGNAPGTGTGTAGTGIGGGNTAGAGGGRTLAGANTGPGATAGSPTGTNVTGGNTAGAGNTIGGTNTVGGGNVAGPDGSVVAGGNTDSGAGSAVITGDAAAGGPIAGDTAGTGVGASTGGSAGGDGGGGGGVMDGLSNAGRTAAVPVVETGVFIANVVTAPITLFEQSGGIVSSGVQIPSTHTAMPALPPAKPFTSEPTRPTDRQPPQDIRPADAQPTDGPNVTSTGIAPTTTPVESRLITPKATPADETVPTTRPARPATPGLITGAATPPAPSAPATPPADARVTTTPPRTLTPAAALSTTAFAIVGQVERPGRYEAGADLTLLQALTAAGLIRNEQADLVKVKLERTGATAVTATLAELRSGTKPDSRLMPGDILTVTVGD